MPMSTCPTEPGAGTLAAALSAQGFAFVPGQMMRALLAQERGLGDWDAFADSWNRLTPDAYLAALGRQRRRRFAVFRMGPESAPRRLEHQAHYQALQYNTLQGGSSAGSIRSKPMWPRARRWSPYCASAMACSDPSRPPAVPRASRCTSSASRHSQVAPAIRHRKEFIAMASTSCWC